MLPTQAPCGWSAPPRSEVAVPDELPTDGSPRIVVTGGGGFLGNAFVVALRRAFPEAEVVALDVRPGPGVTIGDVLDGSALRTHLSGADLLVHTAAVVEESGPVDVMWRVNVE